MGISLLLGPLKLGIDKPRGLVELIHNIIKHFWDEYHDSLVELVDAVDEGYDFS